MVSPLLFLSRMAVLSHLSLVLCPAPTAEEIHIVDEGRLAYHGLCLYPFPSLYPAHDPFHGLVGPGRRVDVYAMRDLAHLASYLSLAKEGAWSQQQR